MIAANCSLGALISLGVGAIGRLQVVDFLSEPLGAQMQELCQSFLSSVYTDICLCQTAGVVFQLTSALIPSFDVVPR